MTNSSGSSSSNSNRALHCLAVLPVTIMYFHLWYNFVYQKNYMHQKRGITYLVTFCSLKHCLHLPTAFSQPILPPSAHDAAHRQCTLILF